MDVDKDKYCQDNIRQSNGWCCNSIIDFLDINCNSNFRTCNDRRVTDPALKYMLCPYSNEKCTKGPNITVTGNSTHSQAIRLSPLAFTEYCYY